jgi:hypothetical protein
MKHFQSTRRTFLKCLLFVSSGAFLTSEYPSNSVVHDFWVRYASFFSKNELGSIGSRCLASHNIEKDVPKLLACLPQINKVNVSEASCEIKNLIIKDFKRERTVLIDGWLLSLTEARLAALIFLVNK